jgi:hypothetical protein
MTTKEIAEAARLSAAAHALLRDDSTSSAFLDELEKQSLFEDAVNFLAHRLSPQNAVKWALDCYRDLLPPKTDNPPLDASDAWAKAPSDATRWAAKEAADKSRESNPADLLALAVFFSGGSITPPGSPETHPPEGTAQKLAAASVHLSVVTHQPENADQRHKRALMLGRLYDTVA